jgi:anthranilate phosphoribosyltransferase
VSVQAAIRALVDRGSLSGPEAAAALEEILTGAASPAQIGAFLAALRVRGETPEVIAACLDVTERHAERVPAADVVDVVGTGGDGADTFNVSTAAALVLAGAGVRVAKHGNRAASSKCGSADVLETLGANLDLTGEAAAAVIDGCGFCFLFAQRFHPAFRHVGGPRREMGVRTLFNIIGPLANPARPAAMLVGVGTPALGPVMAETLRLRGLRRAMIVHSDDGLDEISIASPTHAWLVDGGAVTERALTPGDFGLQQHNASAMAGGDPTANAAAMRALLSHDAGSRTDFVLANAAGALWVAGKTDSLRDGVAIARETLDSYRARDVLDRYVALSQEHASA